MSLTVLVVDNNPVFQKALSGLLEKEGCRVITADDGLAALEVIKTDAPDLLFTDLVMPLVDGAQLCKIVKNTPDYQKIFVVAVSAILFEENQLDVEKIPADLFIVKGSLSELKKHLKKTLALYRQEGSSGQNILGSASAQRLTQDITIEILQEKTHREEIVACLSEGVIELNEQGKIVALNRAALQILELFEEEVIGLAIDTIDWGEKAVQISQWVRRSLQEKKMRPLRFAENSPLLRANKVLTATFSAVSATTFFGLVIVSDITRQYNAEKYNRKLEHSLRLLKKMEAMSSMAGGMAHDFNNLLSVICGNLDMLAMAGVTIDQDRYSSLLQQARESAASTVDLVRKIAHFSPYGIISRTEKDLDTVVRSAIETFYSTRPVSIEQTTDKTIGSVSMDHEQIIVVLHNLMINAVDAGCAKIAIDISQEKVTDSIVEAGQYVPAGDYAKICIKDDGTGIKSGNITKIFDPYYSTKVRGSQKGMGFGLTVAYATIRNHGGYFMVNSAFGAYTRCTIYLPLHIRALTTHATQWVRDDIGGGLVLIVEPDEQSRNIATAMLEFMGFEVLGLTESEAVLPLFCQQRKAAQSFVGAILGVNPQNPYPAMALCRQIHERVSNVAVIALCNAMAEELLNDCESAGFTAIVSKPFTVDELRSALP